MTKERRALLVGAALVLLAGVSVAAGLRVTSVEMTPVASNPVASGVGGLYVKNTDGKPRLVSSGGTEYTAGVATGLQISSGAPGSAALGDCWSDSAASYKLTCKESGGNLQQRPDLTAPGTLGCGTPGAACFSSVTIAGATAEAFFSRTCTITSAAAATPVNCLSDGSVPATKKAYLLGWHAKVSGATNWATTATCTLRDTSAVSFVVMAVAALTGNAFVGDHSANITQSSAYALNSGGTADKGLEIVCSANGTGSDLVVTIYGVIK